MSMTLLSTVTVGTDLPTQIEWTGIPASGKDLLILISARASNGNANVTLNGSSSSYAYRSLLGTGSSVSAGYGSSLSSLFIDFLYEPKDFNGTNNTLNYFSNSRIYIPNYSGTNTKSLSTESTMEFNSQESYMSMNAGGWSGTTAVSSIQLKVSGSGTFNQYSSASLYIIS